MLTIFFIQLLGLVSPGPDFFYVSRKAASSSTRNALCASVGISIGVGLWAIVAVFGLSFLSNTTHSIQYIIMILGGSYLAYTGFKMVSVTENAQFDKHPEKIAKTTIWQEILKGLMINIANAKIAVFFSSVLSAYVAKLTNFNEVLIVLTILIGSALVYFSLVALLFSHTAIRKLYTKYNRYIDNISGAIFILFGTTLIYDGITAFF